MAQYVLRRLLGLIPLIIVISIVLFTMLQLVPGDAFTANFDPNLDKRYYDEMRANFGLDKHPVEQYFIWAGNALKGDFGISFRHKQPVSELIMDRIGNSFFLAITSMILVYAIAIPLGVLSAEKQYSKLDFTLTGAAFVGLAMPSFFLGLLMIYFFSFKLGWFPFGNTVSAGKGYEGIELFFDRLHHTILPAATLAIIQIAIYMRYIRSSVITAKQQDFVRTAFAKGVPKNVVMRKHVLRNALLPLITLFGIDLGFIVSGAIITETVFSYPGIGLLFIEAITNRDYPVVMAVNMIIALCVLMGNLVADILYGTADPRIRYD